jgi:hypothetical protein
MSKPRLLVYRPRSDSSHLGDEIDKAFDVNRLTLENGRVEDPSTYNGTPVCAALVLGELEPSTVATEAKSEWKLPSEGEHAVRVGLKAVWNSLLDLSNNWGKDDRGCQVLIDLPPVLPWLPSRERLGPYATFHALVGFIRALSSAEDVYSFRINGLVRQNANAIVSDKLCSYLLSYSADWINGYIFAVIGGDIVLLTHEEPMAQIFVSDTTDWSSALQRWQVNKSRSEPR